MASKKIETLRNLACVTAALAGLTGAGGMILSAVAAHSVPDPRLHTAATLMLLNGAAALAVSGLALAVPHRGKWFLAAAGVLLSGSILFGGDLSLRVLYDTRLFPMAAPLGGALLILGWLVAALAALTGIRPSQTGTDDQNIDE
ncbi:MAG: DUF423 domain-containing protein [Beijerinckiaceae bacterium]|nr:DUF423 domain-containing protein [Beijerinckiaceae bacterium]